MNFLTCFAASLFVLAANPLAAVAACGDGKAPSYDDITAVQFQRHGCGTLNPTTPTSISCSSYSMFVSNWDRSQGQAAEYYQSTLPGSIGTYELLVDGKDVITVLKAHDFFRLNPPDVTETDVGYSVLTVKRCAETIHISLPAEGADGPFFRVGGGLDPKTIELFQALDRFVEKAPKKQVSSDGTPMQYNWDGMP